MNEQNETRVTGEVKFDLLTFTELLNNKVKEADANFDYYLLTNEKLNLKDENNKPLMDLMIWSVKKGENVNLPEGYEIKQKLG